MKYYKEFTFYYYYRSDIDKSEACEFIRIKDLQKMYENVRVYYCEQFCNNLALASENALWSSLLMSLVLMISCPRRVETAHWLALVTRCEHGRPQIIDRSICSKSIKTILARHWRCRVANFSSASSYLKNITCMLFLKIQPFQSTMSCVMSYVTFILFVFFSILKLNQSNILLRSIIRSFPHENIIQL